MNKIIFVSDFFIDEILGGAEKCNDALIKQLKKKYKVEQHKSSTLTLDFLKKNSKDFYIIANFFHLSNNLKNYISQNLRYIIYEHDHKYLASNNPVHYKDFIAPFSELINRDFFKNAQNVICQSELHSQVVYKNLLIGNIVNAAGNFWDSKDLEILENYLDTEKEIEYAAFQTSNKNKGMNSAVNYCNANNLDLMLLPQMPYKDFIQALSKVKKLVFFPQWLESYSRVAVESKILGCSLVTNKFLGVASEPYFKLRGRALLNKIKDNNNVLLEKINKIISGDKVDCNFSRKSIPKVTVSCTFYKGEKYIKGFLEDITQQTIFDKCELIIVNANSPENEESIILEFMEKFDNIKYHKLDYKASTTEVINMVIKDLGTGDYMTFGCVDDRRKFSCLETQVKNLMFYDDVGLVYGDCLQTNAPNETYEQNSSGGVLYEHSRLDFSKENMIKCLPGPLPMWKKDLHKNLGYFNEEFKFANDWDMWLRFVQSGVKFQKIPEVLGLYYFNPEGNSTNQRTFKEKIKEENKVFLKNKEIFGVKNFDAYKEYFAQGV